MNEDNAQGFIHTRLPWIVGAVTFVVFLLTLNHWVSLRSLGMAARVAGWDLELPMHFPLYSVVSFPFRFLPASVQPIALNLFTALCGGLTVALLCRSISLLPHDRTHEQRIRERSEFSFLSIPLAWVPLILASGALAFQLTFWEHATSVTGEMLDLLLFAYVIRCLLEYRIAHEERWLSKMALVYGLAVTNNWAMIGFFPFFLGAVIWIKGVRFFDPGFLVRMALLGISGLLMYLLLPIVWAIKGDGDYTFFQVLQANWMFQKLYLVDARSFRTPAFLLALTSVLPVILMGIRWRTSVGDVNAAGSFLTNLAFRVIHLFFLGACLWITFDPKYSPRELGKPLTFLTFYYLAALAIGYYAGYTLLVFSEPPRKSRFRENNLGKLLNPIARFAVLAAMVLVPVGLLYKNQAAVRGDNGDVLKEFSTRMAESLPPAPAYLFSDDPYALLLLQAHLGTLGNDKGYVFVNTPTLESPGYQLKMRKRYGDKWPSLGTVEEMGARVPQVDLQALVRGLADSTNVVTYIHPSFGYFFEQVYSVPNGQAYRLLPFATNQVVPPPLTAEQIAGNSAFWSKSDEYIKRVNELKKRNSTDAFYVGRYYSRALNTWGVHQQRTGKVTDAAAFFENAYELNTNNVPARVNSAFNKVFQTGAPRQVETGKTMEEQFGGYRSWDKLLADNGPFDHPEFCNVLGSYLFSQTQFRQAALQFSRTIAFEPTNFTARISYVKCLIGGDWVPNAVAEVDRIMADFKEMDDTQKVDLANLRASLYFKQNEFAKAEELLRAVQKELPEQTALSESLFELYRAAGQYTNALAVIDQQLALTPTNAVIQLQKAELQLNHRHFAEAHETLDRILELDPKRLLPQSISAQLLHAFAYIQEAEHDKAIEMTERILREDSDNAQALLYKGIAYLEKKDLDKARQALDQVISMERDNIVALRNRAILNLRAQRWGEAKDDYELLRKITPKSHAVMYGLGEVAFNEGKRAEATSYYNAYLKYAPAEGGPELEEEKKKIRQRLQELNTPGK